MEISQGEFARRAHVSKQAVSKQLKLGNIVRGKKGIDPAHPTNAAYLARALGEQMKKGPATVKREASGPGDAGGKTKAQGPPKPATKKKPERIPESPKLPEDPEGKTKADKLRAALEGSGLEDAGFDVDEMVSVILQKGYWDTLKVKEEVLKKQLDRAREVGSVIDQRIIESEINAFGQAIAANFVDSPQKQAIQICQMLGAEGKEKQITEYLERDNSRRLEECDRAAKKIADRLRRGRRKGAA